MSYFILVQIVDGLNHLLKDNTSFILAETSSLVKPIKELPSLTETAYKSLYSVTM